MNEKLRDAVRWLAQDPDLGPLEEHRTRGLPVLLSNPRPDIATDLVLARLEEALGLIQRYLPERFARLERDLVALLVRRFPCRAAFFPTQRLCLVELTFLAHPEITAAQVAASIVHEGVHAELAAHPDARLSAADEERRCRQAEIEFGLLVPGGEAVVTRARDALGLADAEVAPAIDWDLARARVARVDRGDSV